MEKNPPNSNQMVVVVQATTLEEEEVEEFVSSSSSGKQTKKQQSGKMIELTPKQAQRYHELFKRLDTNSDGKIDVSDLLELFERVRNNNNSSDSTSRSSNDALTTSLISNDDQIESVNRAKKFISKGDTTLSGNLSFIEFVNYMLEHEKILELVFKGIDTDNNNKISSDELMNYFKKLNIEITQNEAKKLVKKINKKNGSLVIEPTEWKNYFLFTPIDDVDDLISHWRYSTLVDIGEGNTVPDDFSTEETRLGLAYRNLIAGAIAGAVSRTFTAPFDRLKTVMQALGSRKQIKIIGGFQHMLNEGGFLSLWRGNGMNVLKITPEAALKFTFYEEFKMLLIGRETREPTVFERFISGSFAGAMAQSIIYPMELLKTRMVLRKTGEYSSIFDCANKIVKNEGMRAFYKGYIPNILGIIPYAGIDLAVYETLKKFYMKRNKIEENPSIPVLLACGSISTTSGQLVSYPLALVRTRLQAQEVPMDSSERDTMRKLMVRIWRNEGIRGFYRGLLPNIIKVVPAVSISYVVYEKMKKYLIDPVKNRTT